jgi:flagellar biosynthetic protein FliR
MPALEALAPYFDLAAGTLFLIAAVFARVGAAVSLMPGFGETGLPLRVKLGAAIAFTVVIWPAVAPLASFASLDAVTFGLAIAAEAVAGLLLGLSIRLLIFALQLAGSVAAQSTSVAQMFGEGLTADPQPAYANLLAVAGVALAFALGLPVYAASAMIASYDTIPFATFPHQTDLAAWGVGRMAATFGQAVAIAAPFLVAALAYNLALGAINKAMPSLMVAFVGAPAITGGALFLMILVTPVALAFWSDDLRAVLLEPFSAGF